MSGLTGKEIMAALGDHAAASGYFDSVYGHEPKKAPGTGITAAAWVQRIRPVRTSGLNSTSALVVGNVRCYTSMLAEPQDAIDPNLLAAVDALMAAYNGDFTLGGLIRKVDVFGEHGVELAAEAGYLQQDQRLLRVMTIVVPMVVNDAWTQSP